MNPAIDKVGEKIGDKIVRWGKFNLVGAMGMAVQLGALALINHVAPGHYMLATAAAIELTLLHNFVWHLHYTWRDRYPTLDTKSVFRMGHPGDRGVLARNLLRFHLSNGLVSLLGNLALMPVLVESARIPVVAANAIAILGCSIVNFFLGDQWAFVSTPPLNTTASPTQHE
jgi:putative flippase GtrA